MSRFIVSYKRFQNDCRPYIVCICDVVLVLCLPINVVVDSCSTCIRKSIFSLMSLNTSTHIIVQSRPTLNSDVYTTSELYQRWVKALIILSIVPIFFHFTMDIMTCMLYLHV